MPSKAIKLLKRLRQTQNGWTAKELLILYQHFGFIVRAGSKHDMISHPDFPEIRNTLSRGSGDLLPIYAKNALKSIEFVIAKRGQEVLENLDEDNDDVE